MPEFEYPYYNISESVFPKDRCIGNNERRTLVLVEQKDFADHGALLTKILRAVDLDFEQDISFIPVEKNERISFLNTSDSKEYENILLFGLEPQQIGLMTNPGQGLLRLEDFTVIVSSPLSAIAKDPVAKRNLWGHLQRVFKK